MPKLPLSEANITRPIKIRASNKKGQNTPMTQRDKRVVNARFDVAQTTRDNARTWSMTDAHAPDVAYNKHVRKIIRDRARSEIENDAYASGIVDTYVNDIVGTGPRMQVLIEDRDLARRVEDKWESWVRAISLNKKLRTSLKSRVVDGEGIKLISYNPGLPHSVKLDVQLVECERLTDPTNDFLIDYTDGINLDTYGNPISYKILIHHPGDVVGITDINAYDTVGASFVIHSYKQMRPEQHRGYSQLAPALQLFNDLRRYTVAVLSAAETAADFAAVVESQSLPDEIDEAEPMDLIELEKRMATILPKGWKLNQIKAEQPTNTYSDFKHAILAQIARCLSMPYNIAAMDSAGHNFSSAKLDHRNYMRTIKVEQEELDAELYKISRMFFMELQNEDGFEGIDYDMPREFLWEEPVSVDPRDAISDATRIQNGMDNLVDYYARRKLDWEVELDKQSQVKRRMEELGLNYDFTIKQTEILEENEDGN